MANYLAVTANTSKCTILDILKRSDRKEFLFLSKMLKERSQLVFLFFIFSMIFLFPKENFLGKNCAEYVW